MLVSHGHGSSTMTEQFMLADYLTVVVASGRLKDLFNYSCEGKQILFMYR